MLPPVAIKTRLEYRVEYLYLSEDLPTKLSL